MKSRSPVVIVTRQLNDVINKIHSLHGSRKPFSISDCKNARLQLGNDKLHFQCLLALCLYRDTAVFLVEFMISFALHRYSDDKDCGNNGESLKSMVCCSR